MARRRSSIRQLNASSQRLDRHWRQRRRELKKADGAESCNFSKDTANFQQNFDRPTKKIIGAHYFNFALKFSQNQSFQPEILHI